MSAYEGRPRTFDFNLTQFYCGLLMPTELKKNAMSVTWKHIEWTGLAVGGLLLLGVAMASSLAAEPAGRPAVTTTATAAARAAVAKLDPVKPAKKAK